MQGLPRVLDLEGKSVVVRACVGSRGTSCSIEEGDGVCGTGDRCVHSLTRSTEYDTKWTEERILAFETGLRQHGKRFHRVGERVSSAEWRVRVCACVRARVRVCVCARARACVRVRVRVSVVCALCVAGKQIKKPLLGSSAHGWQLPGISTRQIVLFYYRWKKTRKVHKVRYRPCRFVCFCCGDTDRSLACA
jgi:hypothetical protein